MIHDYQRLSLHRRGSFLGSLALALLLLYEAAYAAESTRRYDVHIDGMACAYCAYNVGKHLGRLEGVIPDSVRVDLGAQRVRFHARTELPQSRIENALADSAFTVKAIEWQALDDAGETAAGLLKVKITIPIAALDSALAERLLETLAEAAAAQNGRLVIQAPAARETALIRPMLMGRRPAIPVDFQAIDSDNVSVALWAPTASPGTGHE